MNTDAQIIQHDLIKKMTPQQKLDVSMRMYHSAKELKAAWFRQQHPEWTEEEVKQAVREVFISART